MMETMNVKEKLLEAGVDPNCTETEKITHLWNLYIKTQVSSKHVLQLPPYFHQVR